MSRSYIRLYWIATVNPMNHKLQVCRNNENTFIIQILIEKLNNFLVEMGISIRIRNCRAIRVGKMKCEHILCVHTMKCRLIGGIQHGDSFQNIFVIIEVYFPEIISELTICVKVGNIQDLVHSFELSFND